MALKIKSKSPVAMVAAFFLLMAVLYLLSLSSRQFLILNLSSSEPLGVYYIVSSAGYSRGELVLLNVPMAARSLIYGRGFLPEGWPLIKNIGAVAGDNVCITSETLSINGKQFGPVFKMDSEGRSLPEIRGCFTIKAGYFLPVAPTEQTIDGRYFGPVAMGEIKGKAKALLLF